MREPIRPDMAPGYTWAVIGCAPHESAEAARQEEERLRRTWARPVRLTESAGRAA